MKSNQSYSTALQQLTNLVELDYEWTSGPIKVKVATSITDDSEFQLNLIETIGHKSYAPAISCRNDTNCYWLHSSLNQNNPTFRQEHIHPMFIQACRDAGFVLSGHYRKERSTITFKCNRFRFHEQDDSEKVNQNHTDVSGVCIHASRRCKTRRPVALISDLPCKFRFNIIWDQQSCRWFLPKKQCGSINHCGH